MLAAAVTNVITVVAVPSLTSTVAILTGTIGVIIIIIIIASAGGRRGGGIIVISAAFAVVIFVREIKDG